MTTACLQKLGFYESSYAIPCIVRAPGRGGSPGTVVEAFTEAVDVLPTVAELLGQDVPAQCDGVSLVPFLDGSVPDRWRTAVHWEWDWRDSVMGPHRTSGGPDRRLERANLAVERDADHAYVQFGDGTWLCFDLAADPGWHVTTRDPSVVLPLSQSMLTWRSRRPRRGVHPTAPRARASGAVEGAHERLIRRRLRPPACLPAGGRPRRPGRRRSRPSVRTPGRRR